MKTSAGQYQGAAPRCWDLNPRTPGLHLARPTLPADHVLAPAIAVVQVSFRLLRSALGGHQE